MFGRNTTDVKNDCVIKCPLNLSLTSDAYNTGNISFATMSKHYELSAVVYHSGGVNHGA
jgi:hypothetical protein